MLHFFKERRRVKAKARLRRAEDSGRIVSGIDLLRQHALALRLSDAQRADQYFFIDIVGTCNLRCPSCAVGNMPAEFAKGHMPIEKLRSILEKISHESDAGARVFIDLYNWGEPLLHPKIGDAIKLVHDFGFGCGVSSNLVFGKYIADVARAAPEYLRISLSGYSNEVYQQTHVGGDVNVVKANMHMLRHHLDRHQNEKTVVQVGYHVYRTNFPKDFRQMLILADDLGFLFSPVVASMMPVEKCVDILNNKELSQNDADVIEKLIVHPREWKEMIVRSGIALPDCQFRTHRSTINFDGSVSLCCAVYGADKIIARDFESIAQSDLMARRRSHDYCATCMGHRLHYVFTGVKPPELDKATIEILGPDYAEYINATKFIGDRAYLFFDDTSLHAQDIYDRGVVALNGHLGKSNLDEAERCFDALAEQAPWFGAGLLQAALLKQRRGEIEAARGLISQACQLYPDDLTYQQLREKLSRDEVLEN